MIAAGKYLLEVSLATGLVFLIYVLVFKSSTFFKMNRAYLIIGLVLSFVLPLIDLPASVSEPVVDISISNLNPLKTEYVPFLIDKAEENSILQLPTIIACVYVAVAALMLLRFVLGIVRTLSTKNKAVKSEFKGVVVYLHPDVPTFSFLNTIFSAPENLNPQIIRHELVHINQRHWADLIVLELSSIILWFNPVMILYKRAVKIQHEFLADQGAIQESSMHLEQYLQCMINASASANEIPSTSQFGAHSIKTRITMMTKDKTPFAYSFLYLLIIPAMTFLLFAFQESPSETGKTAAPTYTLLSQNTPADAPVDIKKVRQFFAFGEKFNPVTNKMQHHTGFDFVTNAGENVMATADGIVIDNGFDEIKGNFVVIKHSSEITTQYFHMQRATVKKGSNVKRGEVIGFVGTTGLSIKDHLHYEVLKNGKAVNPKDYLPANIEGC